MIFREVLRKLDYLLEKFLLFASKEAQFETYLRSVADEIVHGPVVPPPVQKRPAKRIVFQIEDMSDRDEWIKDTVEKINDKYTDEIGGIDEMLQKDDNLHNQAVLEKRKEVLQRRSQYVVRIGEILINLAHQLNLMEDTFGLINDEIRARSPEQVLADIDDVVFQTEQSHRDFARRIALRHDAARGGGQEAVRCTKREVIDESRSERYRRIVLRDRRAAGDGGVEPHPGRRSYVCPRRLKSPK